MDLREVVGLKSPDILLTKPNTFRALQAILSMWARGQRKEVKVKFSSQMLELTRIKLEPFKVYE